MFGTGLNQLGQLGYHKRLDEAGRQTGEPLEMLILPASITLPLKKKETLRRVAAGRTHSLALTSEGRVLSWGNNAYGQCGRPVIEQEDYFVNQVVHELEVELIRSVVALLNCRPGRCICAPSLMHACGRSPHLCAVRAAAAPGPVARTTRLSDEVL